jgi:hypothetical protein
MSDPEGRAGRPRQRFDRLTGTPHFGFDGTFGVREMASVFATWRNRWRAFVERHRRHGPILAFIAGFVYDSLTLTRIDRWSDNMILLAYLLASGVLIVVIGRVERGRLRSPWLLRRLDGMTSGVHFFMGGLLSSYVVFYFRSAAIGKSLIFVGLLIGLMVINEFFSHRLRDLRVLATLYGFCGSAFFTFFLPILVRRMSALLFVLSGVLGLALTGILVVAIGECRRDMVRNLVLPTAVFGGLLLGYFGDVIPPVPLAVKEGGIYRSVRRVGARYEVVYREPPRWLFWRQDEREFAYGPGDTVYCFTAIFAPTAFTEQVWHYWQRRDDSGTWITTDRIAYTVVGGRDGGYRGYTFKRKLAPGPWRVEVHTAEGRVLGRIPFVIVPVSRRPERLRTDFR